MKWVTSWTAMSVLPVAVGVFVACTSATEPLPDEARRAIAPPVYAVWWSMIESCSGRSGDLASIDWYVIPGVAQFSHRNRVVSGFWSKRGNRIVVAERALLDGGLVRHEMLHALSGDAGHSRDAFVERCGGSVVCLTGCLEEIGPAPVVGMQVPRIQPGEMRVNIALDPAHPERALNDGHFRLVVTVTNPRPDSVVVLLPSSGDAPPESFSFLVSGGRVGAWFTEHAWDSGVTVFGPHASRRTVFDFTLADRFDGYRALPEGTYSVQGGFGPALSAARSYVLGDSR